MQYRLLTRFRALFDGVKYRHRNSSLGDSLTTHVYEDLLELGRSPKLVASATQQSRVINTKNVTVGKSARRGDGTFGERVPGSPLTVVDAHKIAFGKIATVDIGIEVKILAKAMIKQLDCVFHAKAATGFTSWRPGISRQDGHRFHAWRPPPIWQWGRQANLIG